MKRVLSDIVELQAETALTLQDSANHLNALANTLMSRDRELDAAVRKQLSQQQIASREAALKMQSTLDRIRKEILELQD